MSLPLLPLLFRISAPKTGSGIFNVNEERSVHLSIFDARLSHRRQNSQTSFMLPTLSAFSGVMASKSSHRPRVVIGS